MSITLLFGCAQIETTVGDLAGTRAFMQDVLGGAQAERKMASEITDLFPAGGYAVEHFDCGEGLFQVNAPSPRARFEGHPPVHQAYLDRIGPCVTNLNYYVDDAVHARDLLAGLGAATYIEAHRISFRRWRITARKTRARAAERETSTSSARAN